MVQEYNNEEFEHNSNIEYVKELTEKIDTLSKEKEDINNKYLYLLADFQNQKRQYESQIYKLKETATSNVIKNILPVIDDLNRAINTEKDTCDKDGINLITKKLYNVLSSYGLTEINPLMYEKFDDNTMTAVATKHTDIVEMQNTVAECIQPGFIYKDGSVLRHASVVVHI